MRRDVTLEEISDGKLYGSNDMVKADCRIAEAAATAVREWGILSSWILMMSGGLAGDFIKAQTR